MALVDCLQKSSLVPELKQGLRARTKELARDRGISAQEAAIAAAIELRDNAAGDIDKVTAALPAPAPGVQAATRGRTKPQDEAVKEAIAKIHAEPAKRFPFIQKLETQWEAIKQRTLELQAELPEPEAVNADEQIAQVDARETKSLEDLAADETTALDRVSEEIATRYAPQILAQTDSVKRAALQRESQRVATQQKRGVQAKFRVERQKVSREATLRRQHARAMARQATLAASKEGKRMAAELRKVRAFAAFEGFLEALPPEVRGRIGGIATLASLRSTEEGITNFLVKKIGRIDKELERFFAEEYQEAVTNLLATYREKRTPSRTAVKSRIGPEAQGLVNRVTSYVDMEDDAVQAESDKIETQLKAGTLSPEQESEAIIRQHELQTYGALNQRNELGRLVRSAKEIAHAYETLRESIKTRRVAWQQQEKARLEQQRAKSAEIIRSLGSGTSPGISAKNEQAILNWFRNFSRDHQSLGRLLHRLFPELSFTKEWEDRSRRADNADRDYVLDVTNRFHHALSAAIGNKSGIAVGGQLRAMQERNINVPGGKITKREAIQYYMAWQQEDVRTRMEGQGWTEADIDRLGQALSDPMSQGIMRFLRQIYDEIWEKANETHRQIYGVNMPKIANYVPMRYVPTGMEADPLYIGGPLATSGMTPSAIKGRVAHNQPLKAKDALEVFMEHLAQMSHWTAFAEMNRELRGVLSATDAKMSIQQSVGDKGYASLMRHVDTIARGGAARASEVATLSSVINLTAAGVATTAIAGNLHSVAMQVDSLFRWMFEIPFGKRWVQSIIMGDWITKIPVAWKSASVQRRILEGMSPTMRYAMQATNLTPARAISLVRLGFWPMRMMDAFFTSISSAIVYGDAIRQGMTHEEALDKMDSAIHRFSQPVSITSRSGIEVSGDSLTKMVLMFMADPIIKTAIFTEGIVDAFRPGATAEERLLGGQRIVALGFMAMVTWYIGAIYRDAFSDDDDEEIWTWGGFLNSLALIPFQGWAYVGDVSYLITQALGEKGYPKTMPVTSIVEKGTKVAMLGRDLLTGEKDLEEELLFGDREKTMRNLANITRVLGLAGPTFQIPAILLNFLKPLMGWLENEEKGD